MGKQDPSRDKVQPTFEQLELYLGVYKHHFDIAVKGIVVYLATVGATAGYVFADNVSEESQVALSAFAVLVSACMVIGCFVCLRWVDEMGRIVDEIAAELKLRSFPMVGARGLARVVAAIAAIIFVLSGANLAKLLA